MCLEHGTVFLIKLFFIVSIGKEKENDFLFLPRTIHISYMLHNGAAVKIVCLNFKKQTKFIFCIYQDLLSK